MEKQPLLSICIPTYNREKFLKRLLDSIVSQKEFTDTNNVEIVVDDGPSSDNTETMVREYIKKYGNKIKYYRNPVRIGMCPAFLEALDYGNGKYLWLFGSDDIMNEYSLSIILPLIKENKGNVILSRYGEIIETRKINKKNKQIKRFKYFNDFLYYLGDRSNFMSDDMLFTFISCFTLRCTTYKKNLELIKSKFGYSFIQKNYFNFSFIAYYNNTSNIYLVDSPILGFHNGGGGRDPKPQVYRDIKFLITYIRNISTVGKANKLFKKMLLNWYINCVVVPKIRNILPKKIYDIIGFIWRNALLKFIK